MHEILMSPYLRQPGNQHKGQEAEQHLKHTAVPDAFPERWTRGALVRNFSTSALRRRCRWQVRGRRGLVVKRSCRKVPTERQVKKWRSPHDIGEGTQSGKYSRICPRLKNTSPAAMILVPQRGWARGILRTASFVISVSPPGSESSRPDDMVDERIQKYAGCSRPSALRNQYHGGRTGIFQSGADSGVPSGLSSSPISSRRSPPFLPGAPSEPFYRSVLHQAALRPRTCQRHRRRRGAGREVSHQRSSRPAFWKRIWYSGMLQVLLGLLPFMLIPWLRRYATLRFHASVSLQK